MDLSLLELEAHLCDFLKYINNKRFSCIDPWDTCVNHIVRLDYEFSPSQVIQSKEVGILFEAWYFTMFGFNHPHENHPHVSQNQLASFVLYIGKTKRTNLILSFQYQTYTSNRELSTQ